MQPSDYAFLNFLADVNYSVMQITDTYYFVIWNAILFTGALIGMSPLKSHHEFPFYQLIFIFVRKILLAVGVVLIILPFIMLFIYDVTNGQEYILSQNFFLQWFKGMIVRDWFTIFGTIAAGWLLRFMFRRYAQPFASRVARLFRNNQTDEKPTDIRDERNSLKAKDFVPTKHYKKDHVFVGLDDKDKPIYIPCSTWYETNMQVIGPTRYGKGVLLGNIMDQSIKRGDAVFYFDPKKDKFAPHVMYQAALEAGRKFYYVSLHDEEIGSWGPFLGGTEREAFSRAEVAFGLELTGDPGTDYYKSQERKEFSKAFSRTRSLKGLLNELEATDANRVVAELVNWTAIESLCPKKKTSFSIEKALLEGAVVYVRGSLDDATIKTATKIFIMELIQESRRLEPSRPNFLTAVVDEVSFLVSRTLAQSMATSVGFRVNFALAYQSPSDLLNLDDKTINSKYIYQSINVNSQIKAIYGGADYDTAEYVAKVSGTITKQVTKMEKTDVSSTGGETYENQRMIGALEENLITENMVLSLDPRICVFIQPRSLASVMFTSFIPVSDMSILEQYIENKLRTYKITPTEIPTLESINSDNVSQAKPDETTDTMAPQKSHSLGHRNSVIEQEDEPTEIDEIPIEKQAVSQAKPVASSSISEDEITPIVRDISVADLTDEVIVRDPAKSNNNTAKNKARKQRQKQKKVAAKESVSQAKQTAKSSIVDNELAAKIASELAQAPKPLKHKNENSETKPIGLKDTRPKPVIPRPFNNESDSPNSLVSDDDMMGILDDLGDD